MMGVGLPMISSVLLSGCKSRKIVASEVQPNFNGKVLIVGAGAAGMAAGYLLKHYGIDFTILEASNTHGGRLKKAEYFVDFPLDLGAEWIHTHPDVFSEILKLPAELPDEYTMDYDPQTISTWSRGELKSRNFIRHLYSEWKFARSTWFDFFDQYIYSEIKDQIHLNSPVFEIHYGGDGIVVRTKHGTEFTADKVIVTTSIKMLQNQSIQFSPELPIEKRKAIDDIFMGDGIKIFIEFKEKFYPDITAFGNIFRAFREEEKFYYDAAFGKTTKHNLLGLFAINEQAYRFTRMENEQSIMNEVLNELDEMFEGRASENYLKHIIQNWSDEPYIQGAYSYAIPGPSEEIIEQISEPIEHKLYFAGEALSIENQAMVHGVVESAYGAVSRLLIDRQQ